MRLAVIPQGENPLLRDLMILAVEREKGYSLALPPRQKITLVYVLSGAVRYQWGARREITLQEGESILFGIGDVATVFYEGEKNRFAVLSFFAENPAQYAGTRHFLPNAAVGRRIRELLSLAETHQPVFTTYALGQLYLILAELHLCGEETAPHSLREILANMESDPCDHTPIPDLAAQCSVCESVFRRQVKKITGLSPTAYRNRIRLRYAEKLLMTGNLKVSEVAALCGFENLSFFCREYRKQFGITPAKQKICETRKEEHHETEQPR